MVNGNADGNNSGTLCISGSKSSCTCSLSSRSGSFTCIRISLRRKTACALSCS